MTTAEATRLADELRALDRAYSQGHHGRWSARRRSDLVDATLVALFQRADAPAGIALVALGGYGRRALAPASDVDLLVLHADGDGADVERVVDGLLYPLWDAGLAVGHAVRTPAEAVAIAADRLDALTATLDGRLVAGDGGRWSSTSAEVRSLVEGERARAFAARLLEDAERRAERFGAVSFHLEPDLKEGRGGLRDANALRWVSIALAGAPGGLVGLGLLREPEADGVDEAEELLSRARSAIHLLAGRPGDRLVRELQSPVAAAMGFADEPATLAVDALMRNVFEHARRVDRTSRAVLRRVLGDAVGDVEVEPTPSGVLRAATGVARRGGVLGPRALDRLAAAGVPDPVEWTDEVRGAFLDLLDAGPGAVDALETLDGLGLLERYLPAWTAVRCRPQRDPYHRSTVDVHLLSTLAAASELLARPDEPVAEAAVGLVEDRRALLLGALLHDIGKTGGGGHVPVGLAIAAETLDRMSVAEPAAGLVRFLVAEHLLLSDTATRRDLEDEEQILDVAARVGDEPRLAALYLLTRADAEATGPLAWTPWRAALVRELVAKVQRALERGAVGPGVGERLVERTDEVRRLLASRDALDVERFLDGMPRAYLLNVPPERVARHFGLLRPPPGRLDVRTLEEPGDRPNTYSLTVVAADRPGLLAQIAGALSLSGLSILTAQVFTTEAGDAVDVFEVEGAFEPNVTEERWRRFRSTLRRALDGRLSLDHGVRERRAQYPPPRLDLPVDVVAHTDASDFFTVVEVGAPDRIGLLFDITTAFTAVGLDVHLAKVATYGGRVVDAFYVRDELGRKVEDPERIADLERVLKERLGAGKEGER